MIIFECLPSGQQRLTVATAAQYALYELEWHDQ